MEARLAFVKIACIDVSLLGLPNVAGAKLRLNSHTEHPPCQRSPPQHLRDSIYAPRTKLFTPAKGDYLFCLSGGEEREVRGLLSLQNKVIQAPVASEGIHLKEPLSDLSCRAIGISLDEA